MRYESFSDLPRTLQRYGVQFGWDKDSMDRWLHQPIPHLGGRSVLQALEEGDYQSVYQVFLRVGDAVGVEGLPEDFEPVESSRYTGDCITQEPNPTVPDNDEGPDKDD